MVRNTVIGILFLFLISACGNERGQAERPVAQSTAETVRDGWKKSCRPFVVCIANEDELTQVLPYVCVHASVSDATAEEREAFGGVCYMRHGESYESSDRKAVTSDTLAPVYVYYPYRQGIGTDNFVTLEAPFTENLFGTETGRNIGNTVQVRMVMHSSMALLRIHLKSDNLHDILDDIRISGENIHTAGDYQPCKGVWSGKRPSGFIRSTDTGCVLNNGQAHDFYLIPTAQSGMMTAIISVNKRSHVLKTTLPPMGAGSLTQLNLSITDGEIAVSGSWVETRRELTPVMKETPDSVCVGQYLQRDGRISGHRDSLSVAVVIETDGTHGKAVGISDCRDAYRFSTGAVSSHRLFPTIDGKLKEGILNPVRDHEVEPDSKIIYKPGMPYSKDCALGYNDGAQLTTALMKQCESPDKIGISDGDMLTQVSCHPASYVPSLAEMASLYYMLQTGAVNFDMDVPAGEYLTSSESSAMTAYLIDMTYGVMTGNMSKRYSKGKLRLFYLF